MKTVNCFKNDLVFHGFYDAKESEKLVDLILLNQVHSADVLLIDQAPLIPPKVDAVVSKTKGLTLAIKTADCAPVLLADEKNQVIGAVHAGWKGAFQGVIENTILKMLETGAELSLIKAAIGPHIQKESFEADEKMKALFPVTEHHFFEEKEQGHYLFDFHGYIVHRLNRAGIKEIESILIDTYQDTHYLSYRRDPKNPARQYSVIRLK